MKYNGKKSGATLQMSNPRYNLDPEYDEYENYPGNEATGVGLPASQLALIIGVNAVISLIISVVVVLIANRQVIPGDIATSDSALGQATDEAAQIETPLAAETLATERVAPETTPLQSVNYVVQQGDTLGLIANKFSVSLFDLMTANGLTNQDFIQIGQELVIPLGGLPTATPTFTPVPIPTETPLPFDPPTPLPEGVEPPPEPAATVGPSPTPTETPTALPTSTMPPFNEIQVAINSVIGPGDLFQETVVILNQGAGVSLNGWKLEGSPLANFSFPDVFLFSGGSIRIHTAAGQNTPSDLYLNQGEAVWPPGTTIILRDAQGSEVSSYTVPAP
jgi:LysM repeat protein